MSESDGVEEALDTALRVMLTAAARAGEEVARARQREHATAADVSEARTAEMTARLDAERTAAHTAYRGLDDPQWWDSADVDDIASAYYTATAWRDFDPEAASAAARIEAEVDARHGVTVDEMRRAEAQAREAGALVAAAERADGLAQERVDQAESTRVRTADVSRAAPGAADTPPYDSPERRAASRDNLAAKVDDPRAVEAKSLADLSQARPPNAITAPPRGASPAKRPTSTAHGLVRQPAATPGIEH